jgi:hypothetical protein
LPAIPRNRDTALIQTDYCILQNTSYFTAFEWGDEKAIKEMALDDPDLEQLWADIREY